MNRQHFMQEAKANAAEAASFNLQNEIELDESPRIVRKDFTHLDYFCDNNGDIAKEPTSLERRGAKSQPELWKKAAIYKESVVAKLREISREDLAGPLADCHTEETAQVCTGCKRVTIFLNRCERHYCPSCQPRLARERRESVEWWAKMLKEPKHVVLTVRNCERLTKTHVQWFKQCWTSLRRRKFAANWRGGFYRLEVTNEDKGWHLHLHALVDAGWIDGGKLAKTWAECVDQQFAIVKVKDVHSREYLAEVTKYTVKGSQLAGWTGDQIAEFCDAFQGVKTFGVFGELFGKRAEWRDYLDTMQTDKMQCQCGCNAFRYMTANEAAWEILRSETASGRVCLPPPTDQPDLAHLPNVEGRPLPSFTFEPR